MLRGMSQLVTRLALAPEPLFRAYLFSQTGTLRLRSSPDAGTQLRQPGPIIVARDVLVGEKLDVAITAITNARKAIDEKKK